MQGKGMQRYYAQRQPPWPGAAGAPTARSNSAASVFHVEGLSDDSASSSGSPATSDEDTAFDSRRGMGLIGGAARFQQPVQWRHGQEMSDDSDDGSGRDSLAVPRIQQGPSSRHAGGRCASDFALKGRSNRTCTPRSDSVSSDEGPGLSYKQYGPVRPATATSVSSSSHTKQERLVRGYERHSPDYSLECSQNLSEAPIPPPPAPPPPLNHPLVPPPRTPRSTPRKTVSQATSSRRRAVTRSDRAARSSAAGTSSACKDDWDLEGERPAGTLFDPKLWWHTLYQNCGRRAVLKCIRRRRHTVRLVLGLILAMHILGLLWLSRTLVREYPGGLPIPDGPERQAFLAKLSPQERHAAGLSQLPSTTAPPRHGWLQGWADVPTEPPKVAPAANGVEVRDDKHLVPPLKEWPRLRPGFEEAAAAAVAAGSVPPLGAFKVKHFGERMAANAVAAPAVAQGTPGIGFPASAGALRQEGNVHELPQPSLGSAGALAASASPLQASNQQFGVSGQSFGAANPSIVAAPESLVVASASAQSAGGLSSASLVSSSAGANNRADPLAALTFGVR